MRQFNLDEFLANPNKKLITGDGRKVTRVLCTDAKGPFPIAVLVERFDGFGENAHSYTSEGHRYTVGNHPSDLFFTAEKHKGWVNVYKSLDGEVYCGSVFESEEEAKKQISANYKSTIKIEWEE